MSCRTLDSTNALPADSLGRALLEFSKEPGVFEEHIVSEVTLAFIAGHETTAHTLSFVLYALCRHPEIQTRCQEAIDAAGGDGGDGLLPEYVEAVVKESMRKYPVAHVNFRKVSQKEGVRIGDYYLPCGTWVHLNAYVIQNLECNWGSDVDVFKPERWLSNGSENPLSSPAIYGGGGASKETVSFFPFSHGPRNCLGMNLALLEIRLTLARLLRTYTFHFADERFQDEKWVTQRKLSMRPRDGLPLRVTRRNTQSFQNEVAQDL